MSMDQIAKVRCPACGKWTTLYHATAGVSVYSAVKGLVQSDHDDLVPITSGQLTENGVFAGYVCGKCRAILARDSAEAVATIKTIGFIASSTNSPVEGVLIIADLDRLAFSEGRIAVVMELDVQPGESSTNYWFWECEPKQLHLIQPLIGKRVRVAKGVFREA